MKETIVLLHLCAALLLQPALAQEKKQPLPALGANLELTSVSGISSGGFMAAQMATAYSARFMGVGVIAAGPYYCAGTYADISLVENATTTCMSPAAPSVAAKGGISLGKAKEFAAAGLIDPVENLASQRVYLFSGANDNTVKTVVVDAVQQYYSLAGVPEDRLRYQKSALAGHAIVTANPRDLPCEASSSPYINNCKFVQSHELLRHIYPDKRAAANTGTLGGDLIRFDQGEFLRGRRTSMDADAYAYVPNACRAGGCAVHVAFHGCRQGASVIGATFYQGTGYNEFADANALIVLYPQAHPSESIPANPRGCWDFWGYSSDDPSKPNFHTRGGAQMSAVMAMIERLGQPAAAQP
ncbi:extracellular catalytic domain type 2 short-chain-length polyhydroxyalkanoate depolymerase [Massilia endophytica]|uniref:extracellular catalytic domain type 2 short-chain-length polyhydroxyalkanoate depolymerase n=1 Tax=Massilia endophytica TaxID=2899220 RepID=UPI001E4CCEAD|nr:PHB depolymerase family esterase [Massilia endophytica]UGQ48927.1 PHB depolymerase family esterase [Massilia endophytica]